MPEKIKSRIVIDRLSHGSVTASPGELKVSPDMLDSVFKPYKGTSPASDTFKTYAHTVEHRIMPMYKVWYASATDAIRELTQKLDRGEIVKIEGNAGTIKIKGQKEEEVDIDAYINSQVTDRCRKKRVKQSFNELIDNLIAGESDPLLVLCLRHARHSLNHRAQELLGKAQMLYMDSEYAEQIQIKPPNETRKELLSGEDIEFKKQPLYYPHGRRDEAVWDHPKHLAGPGEEFECHYSKFFLNVAVDNLITNAHDAMADAGIHGKIHVGDGAEKSEVSVYVRDEGPGILPRDDMSEQDVVKYMDELFKLGVTHKQKGTGAGLYLVQGIMIKLFRGNVIVESKGWKFDLKAGVATQDSDIKEGTKFTLTWPDKPHELG